MTQILEELKKPESTIHHWEVNNWFFFLAVSDLQQLEKLSLISFYSASSNIEQIMPELGEVFPDKPPQVYQAGGGKKKKETADRTPSDWAFIIEQDRV